MPKTINIGIVFGHFAPLHRGHMETISQALTENQKVILAVTGHDYDEGVRFIPFSRRVQLMKLAYHIPIVHDEMIVIEVNDTELGFDFSPDAEWTDREWRLWSKKLFGQAHYDPEDNTGRYVYNWYMANGSYVPKLIGIYPENHRFVVTKRKKTVASSETMQGDPQRYKDQMHPIFRDYLIKQKKIKRDAE